MKFFKSVLFFVVFAASIHAMADSLTVGIENDTFIHDDSDYSHGTQIMYKRDSGVWLFDAWGVDILQNMYTPDNISSTEIQYGDRPYCGLLLASVFGDGSVKTKFGKLNLRNEIGFGTTGKRSFAEESQKVVHSIIHSKEPKGWRHQVAQEVIIQYQGYADFNIPVVATEWFALYGIPRASLFLGNYKDQAALGCDLKLGLNPKENQGGNIAFSAPEKPVSKWFTLDLIGGVEGKYVAWDTSLDGTMIMDSKYHVKSENFVGEVHFGATAGVGPVSLDALMICRTKEYENQDEAPNYCRLSVTVDF